MDVMSEIGAIQDRIAQITGASAVEFGDGAGSATQSTLNAANPGAGPAAFNRLVTQALGRNASEGSAEAGDGPAASAAPSPQIEALIEQNANASGVDPALIKAVMANESSFSAGATSPAGAMGLMQLMPETAASLGVANSYDPAQNVWGGTRYLRSLLDRYQGDIRKALAAYNAGPEAVDNHGGVPPYAETQNYVSNVLASYDRYRAQGGVDGP